MARADHRPRLLRLRRTRRRSWHGRCPGCGEWNTLVEEQRAAPAPAARRRRRRRPARAVAPVPLARRPGRAHVAGCRPGSASSTACSAAASSPARSCCSAARPGIGKSTLTSMALGNLAGRRPAHALRLRRGVGGADPLRAERLPGAALDVPVLAETDLDTVLATLDAERPEVCVIDSVQTLHAAELTGAAGSVGQVREVADRITRLAKARDIAVLLVGHVTKEGALAGPRVLEHLVDCVLQFEGERERTYRTLRALKNRFGSTNEAGVFEMRQGGLVEVAGRLAPASSARRRARPAASCWRRWRARGRCWSRSRRSCRRPSSCRRGGSPTGSTATASRSCSRCSPATPASRAGSADVFVNVAGGVRVDEPGADLAVALAVASAARGVPLGGDGRAARWPASARSASRASCAPSPTPTGGWPRRAKFGLAPGDRAGGRERRRAPRRRRCARPCAPPLPQRRARGPPRAVARLSPTRFVNRRNPGSSSQNRGLRRRKSAARMSGDDAAIRGRAHRARSAAGAPARQGSRDGRARARRCARGSTTSSTPAPAA